MIDENKILEFCGYQRYGFFGQECWRLGEDSSTYIFQPSEHIYSLDWQKEYLWPILQRCLFWQNKWVRTELLLVLRLPTHAVILLCLRKLTGAFDEGL